MKKIITLLVTLVVMLGLSGITMATTGGHYTRNGVEVDITTEGHPIMNTVDVSFTYNGQTKTLIGTPNPEGPANDAWLTETVVMRDGTQFKIKRGKVFKKSPDDRSWKVMYERKPMSVHTTGSPIGDF